MEVQNYGHADDPAYCRTSPRGRCAQGRPLAAPAHATVGHKKVTPAVTAHWWRSSRSTRSSTVPLPKSASRRTGNARRRACAAPDLRDSRGARAGGRIPLARRAARPAGRLFQQAPARSFSNSGLRCGRFCTAPMSRPRIMTSSARCAPLSSSARSPARPDPLTPRRPLHRLRLLGDRDLPAPGARCLRVPAANRHHLASHRARSRLGVPGGSQRDVGSAAVRAGGSRGRAHRELEGLAPRGAAFDQAHGPTRTPDRSRARLIPAARCSASTTRV